MDTPYVLLLISQWTTYSFATLLPLNFGMVALFNSDPMGRSQRIFLTSLLYSLKALAEEDERQSFRMLAMEIPCKIYCYTSKNILLCPRLPLF